MLYHKQKQKVAASKLESMSIITPVKDKAFMEKLKAAAAPTEQKAEEEEPIEEYRKRFVGDLECDEKDEPLLKETQRRFVLFPIQYHEVGVTRLYK